MKKEEYTFLKDTKYDGKNMAYLDIDRIINEGMAGGTVFTAGDSQNIEEARDLHDETPPNENN